MLRAVLVLALAPQLFAQRTIQAVGTASVTIRPDQVRIILGVVTSATTAQEAAGQNATQVDAVIKAVTQLIGSKGSIKTVSYSIRADYRTTTGQPAQVVGYTATNNIEVTANDLSLIGPIIDSGVQAGANSIGSPSFSLQDPQPVVQQALNAAARQARAHADAIAAGLGGRTGSVLRAQEGSTYTPILGAGVGATGGTPTPIQPGTLEISATVTIVVELQ